MAFAIAVANLIETMKEAGCPVCRLERRAARKIADGFLYEHMMDPDARQEAISSYGFCPPHTRLLAAVELSSTGDPQGVNLLYETLNRRVARELKQWRNQESVLGGWRRLLQKLGLKITPPTNPLPASRGCPICEATALAGMNALTTLFDELERQSVDVVSAYQHSDGLCLRHLRLALRDLSPTHPQAARWIADRTAQQLENQSALMREFVRKKNWEYRDEKLTPEEAAAWRDSLAFFTGYPGDGFRFDIEDF